MTGDPDSPGWSPEPLRDWLHRLARALLDDRLRGKVVASDVVQDALLKAF